MSDTNGQLYKNKIEKKNREMSQRCEIERETDRCHSDVELSINYKRL